MLHILQFCLFCILLQNEINTVYSGVEHLRMEDQKCFPYDFDYEYEERHFVRLLVVPYLDKELISDLANLEVIPINNYRYNQFLNCMWKNQGFKKSNGRIDFDAIEEVLGKAIGRELGDTGPSHNLSKIEASKIISDCYVLEEPLQDSTVVSVRNCILMRIKKFGNLQ